MQLRNIFDSISVTQVLGPRPQCHEIQSHGCLSGKALGKALTVIAPSFEWGTKPEAPTEAFQWISPGSIRLHSKSLSGCVQQGHQVPRIQLVIGLCGCARHMGLMHVTTSARMYHIPYM